MWASVSNFYRNVLSFREDIRRICLAACERLVKDEFPLLGLVCLDFAVGFSPIDP